MLLGLYRLKEKRIDFANRYERNARTSGVTGTKMVADHKVPLVKEYYRAGKVDKIKMKGLSSVQPQCTTCSNKQGAKLSNFSKQQKKKYGFD